MDEIKPYQRQFPAGDTSGICWDFACPCGFSSSGWPSEELAELRLRQHLEEHETGVPAPDKNDLLDSSELREAADAIAKALENESKKGRKK